MSLSAGFDFSWNEASFSVVEDGAPGKALFERSLPLSGRDASGLPAWMESALGERGLDLKSISSWTVGSGPGSFTGMRLAASLVAGLCFGREDVRMRSMPTAIAMAFDLARTQSFDKAVALFDGRKGDVLAYEMARSSCGKVSGCGLKDVLANATEAEKALPKGAALLALAKDKAAILKFFGQGLAPEIHWMEHVSASALALNAPGDFSSKLSELVYIRPPVFVDPKHPRTLE